MTNGAGTLHVGGTVAVGTPLFVIAFNQDVAWGCTTSYVDSTDIYVETLSEDGTGVLFRGEVVPFVEKTFSIEVAGGEDREVTHRWVPHHGPVVVWAPEEGRVITRRWTGHAAPTDIEAYADMMRATGVADAMGALEQAGGLGCNVVLADSSGDVGWHVASWVPKRPWASPELAPWRYLPGDGSAEWEGYVPFDQHPRVYQPRDGFVATANNAFDRNWFDGDPTNDERPYSQVYYSPGYRYTRIAEELRAIEGGHTLVDSLALQSEDRSLQAPVVFGAILDFAAVHAELLDEDGRAAVAALSDWQMSCPTGLAGNRPDDPASADPDELREARGCLVFHAAQVALGRELFGDEMRMYFDSDAVGGLDDPLHHYLKNPDDLHTAGAAWDDRTSFPVVETREDIFRVALNTTLDIVRAHAGDDPAGWLWGRVHTVTLRSTLGKAQWDVGPFANDGAHMGVDPGYTKYDESGFEHVWGPILRLVVAMHPEGPEAWYQLPGGLDMHSASPDYANLVERWLENDPIPIAFSAADAVSGAREHFTIQPE